jgi:hypothetical protein
MLAPPAVRSPIRAVQSIKPLLSNLGGVGHAAFGNLSPGPAVLLLLLLHAGRSFLEISACVLVVVSACLSAATLRRLPSHAPIKTAYQAGGSTVPLRSFRPLPFFYCVPKTTCMHGGGKRQKAGQIQGGRDLKYQRWKRTSKRKLMHAYLFFKNKKCSCKQE